MNDRHHTFLAWFCFLLFCIALSGCVPPLEGDFSIYLTQSVQNTDQLTEKNIKLLELQPEPLITASDLVVYDWELHTMTLKSSALERVNEQVFQSLGVRGRLFVVCLGKERIYSGAFWLPVSSLSYSGVVIVRPPDPENPVFQLTLGYPSSEFFQGKDPRSDPRIKEALRRVGKER